MELIKVLSNVVKAGASDIFIVAGRPLAYKLKERFYDYSDEKLDPLATEEIITQIYYLANDRSMEYVRLHGDDDFSFSLSEVARFRTNVYRQRGSLACVIRIVHFELPDPALLSIPEKVISLAERSKGLILVTGSSGCGKSTTLACMIDRINTTRSSHIVTLEDPIEFLHAHKKSVISQREISLDTDSYLKAMRASLRQSPDVILIGELRDSETAAIAMTASETGHLVISTLHTLGAANTIDRIIDLFPSDKQTQARLQLSMVLSAVVTQQLVETREGDIIPVFEIMTLTPAIKNMIREAKTHQIESIILSSRAEGMITMDTALTELYEKGVISREVAVEKSFNPENMQKRI